MKQSLLILSTITFTLFVIGGAYILRSRTIFPMNDTVPSDSKLKVVATFYPLGYFAGVVGGPVAVDVSVIVPTGVEPHDYEPTPKDIASMYAADVVVLNGAGIDAWATKIRPDLENKGVKVVVMSESLGFEGATRCSQLAMGDDLQGRCASRGQGVIDPHFWLDPKLAEQEISALMNVFIQVDEKNKDEYTRYADGYIKNLQLLDQSYRDGLMMCANKTIVTSHNAFGYLAKEYGFNALSITEFSPESEPSTRQLADLAALAQQKNIRYIFFETLVSPRLAQTLADEIGAQTLVFNPLEGLTDEEIIQGKNYISVMRENLNNLRLAMNCK